MFRITCALKSLRSWPLEHFTGWTFAVLRAFNPIPSTASLAKRSHYANIHAVESNLKSPFSFPMNSNSKWISICERTRMAMYVNWMQHWLHSASIKIHDSQSWCSQWHDEYGRAKTIWCIINFTSNTLKRLLKLFLSLHWQPRSAQKVS